MTNIFERFSPQQQKKYLLVFAVLTVFFMVVFVFIDAPLVSPSAPFGIVSYELAGTETAADAILRDWDSVMGYAVISLLMDFVFIPTYVITISLGCILAGHSLKEHDWPLVSIDSYLVFALITAGVLDIIENTSLLVQIYTLPQTPWPQIAFYAAITKFAFIFIALVYALYGGSVSILKRLEKK